MSFRTLLASVVAFVIATPALAQTVSLPLAADEAYGLSKNALAQLLFRATADRVVHAQAEPVYMSGGLGSATFLLRPRAAVDSYIVSYDGACSIRRVQITLDMADGGQSVEDIQTDTVWAVLGPMSVVHQDFDGGSWASDPAAAAREAACKGWTDFENLVEAPDAGTLMLGTRVLVSLPELLDGGKGRVTCDDDAVCGAPHRTALDSGRLTQVTLCDDPELMEWLGITENQTCVALKLRLPGGSAFEYDGLTITAAGDWDGVTPFEPSQVWMATSTTYVD